jgi:hypothetical protein
MKADVRDFTLTDFHSTLSLHRLHQTAQFHLKRILTIVH